MACKHRWILEGLGATVPGRCKICGAEKDFRNVHEQNVAHFKVEGKKRREQQERLDAALREAG